jgi:aryl-alcohol dehydrogenase-like predicted oxidoreductase
MILKAWGDWKLFQSLLAVLRHIGDRYGGLSVANIATRWVLDHSFVGAVLIGNVIAFQVLSVILTSLQVLA